MVKYLSATFYNLDGTVAIEPLEALNEQGFQAYQAEDYGRAITIFEKARKQAIREFGTSHLNYANACSWIVFFYNNQGRYAEAEPLVLEAKDIQAKVLGTDHPDYAISCNNLAFLYDRQGRYVEAEPLFLETRGINAKVLGTEHPDYALSCNNLATLYEKQGRYEEAEPLYSETKGIIAKALGKEHPFYAQSCNNLASLYHKQGRYVVAELLMLEAKGIIAKVRGIEHPNYAISCNNLAIFYERQGRYAEAELLKLEAKDIMAKALGKDHPDYPLYCNNLATLYEKQGRYEEAEPLFLEAKGITAKALGIEHPNYAISCDNLAMLYEKQGRYAEAEPLYLEAIGIQIKVLGKEHPDYAKSCNNLAALYKNIGRYAEAEPLYLEAKAIRAKVLGKEHLDYATSCNNMAFLYEHQGRYAEAETFWIEGNHAHLSQLGRNFANLSEKEKGQFLGTFNNAFEAFYSFVLHRRAENPAITAEAYRIALATKGLLFDASNKIRERVLNSGDKELIALYRRWKGQREYLAQLYNLSITEREKQGVNLKTEEVKANDLEKQLAFRSALFGQFTDTMLYTWQDIQKALKPGEAAVELVRFEYFDPKSQWTDSVLYMALIVTPETKTAPELVLLSNGKELEGKYLTAYNNAVKYKFDDVYSYQQFWEPITKKLSGIRRVYFSPDGAYHSLNLLTLQNPATGQYLTDELDIRIVTNTKDLLRARKDRASISVALLGYPDYNTNLGQTDLDIQVTASLYRQPDTVLLAQRGFRRGENIELLEGTKQELEKITALLHEKQISPQILMGQKANEEALKKLDNPAILHIATHGFFLPDAEKQKEDTRLMGIDKQQVFDNPLLRSGLLLANAKQTISEGGDGVLTAYEAMSLNLDGTELVVLSACETGLGEIRNGEGVFGLQRAFQTAGAKTILMSLWQVSDEATQELMVLFYQGWMQKGMSKREAFKQAQRALRQKYPEPYYWGAFVLVGE